MNRQKEALEAMMLATEPTITAEALSLALLLHTELDAFVSRQCRDMQADEQAEPLQNA